MSDPFPSWDAPGPYARQRALEPTEELPVVPSRPRWHLPTSLLAAAVAATLVLAWTLAGAHHGLPAAAPGSSTATATTLVWLRGVVTLPPAPPVVVTTAALVVHTHAPVVRHTYASPAAVATGSPRPPTAAPTPDPTGPAGTSSPGTVAPTGPGPTSTGGTP